MVRTPAGKEQAWAARVVVCGCGRPETEACAKSLFRTVGSLSRPRPILRILLDRTLTPAQLQVRAAQSLALLSHSLKLSLLLSEEPTGHGIRDGIGSRDHGDVPSAPTDKSRSMSGSETAPSPLDEEALRLIKSTLRSRQACAGLLDDILGPSTDAIDGDGEHDFEVGDERGRAEAPLP